MTDTLGPGAFGAARSTTTRPAVTPGNAGGDPDTFFQDCTSQTARDGTQIKAAFLNFMLTQMRRLVRGAAVAESNTDDEMLTRAVRSQRLNWVAPGGTANDITLTPSPAFASLSDLTGVPLRFIAGAANTGAVTLVVNALAAKDVTWPDGTALAAGDLSAGNTAEVIYDGTAFRLNYCLSPNHAFVSLNEYVMIRDEKPAGTNGGDFLSGAWRTRDLNTIALDPNDLVARGLVTLAANRITLGAGRWDIDASAPACAVNSHRARLYNITTSALAVPGTTEQTTQNTNTDQVTTRSIVFGSVTVPAGASHVFELQHYGEQNSTGFSSGVGFGVGASYITTNSPEVYSIIRIRKVA